MEQSFHYLLMAEQSMVQKLLMNQISDTSSSLGQPKVLDYLKNHDRFSEKIYKTIMGFKIKLK